MPLSPTKFITASLLVVGLAMTTACGDDNSPTAPSNPNAPKITALSPGAPKASASTQTITVTGERFASGLTVLFDAPNGVWTTVSGGAITVQSASQFTVNTMLDKVGVWDITVTSADGLESNEVQFSVVQ